MPHVLQFVSPVQTAGNGNTMDPMLIDISHSLTNRFGKLIRQGHTFRVSRVDVQLINRAGQYTDFGVQARGTLRWFSPTEGRVKAWKRAMRYHLNARKLASAPPSKDYDFRVTLDAGGANDTGPAYANAWYHDQQAFVGLVGHEAFNPSGQTRTVSRSVFNSYNEMLKANGKQETGTMGGTHLPFQSFGGPVQIVNDTDTDPADGSNNLVTNEGSDFYMLGEANTDADSLRWNAAFMGYVNDVNIIPGGQDLRAGHSVSPWSWDVPIDVMCGLMSIDIENMSRDAQIANDDFHVQVSLAVEGWKPLVTRRKPKSKGRKRRS